MSVEVTGNTQQADENEVPLNAELGSTRLDTLRQIIVEREAAREQAERSNQRLNQILSSITDDFYVLDREWNFVYTSEQFTAKVGKKPSDFLNRNIWEMFPKHVGTEIHENFLAAMNRRELRRFEMAGRYTPATYRMTAFPSAEGITVLGTDITDQKRAEQRASAQAKELDAIIEAMTEGLITVEPTGHVIRMNRAGARLLGYAHLEEHTRTISDFLDTWSLQTLEGDPVPVEEWPLMRALRGEMFTDYELVARRHDESHACVLSHAGTAIRSDSGEIVRAIVTYRDITGLVEARRSLSLANEQLVEADRRKNEFMAILSHELRNPLTPIKNSLYILDRATPGGAQERRAKETIARQVNQLVRLVDDLLDLTRITRGKVALQRQHLELNALVRKTLDDHNTVFENSHIELSFEPASHSVWVDADYNRLAQIVGNLLQNSAKFTPAGGRVTARVFGDETLQQAEIQISDTGVGIDAHMLQRLFEPFMQADNTIDRTRGGLGLGLALVKTLAELHGGCVEVESAGLGLGTTFTVRFPKLHDVTRPPPSSEQQLAGTASERVLIIEDNVDAADSLCMLLQLEGYNVVVTYDGPSGLAKALTWRPAVILCDIGLPGMDGYAIARAIRRDATLEATRLVALSGYSRPEDVRCARDAGFDQHMSKPPNFEQLRALLAARNSCP